LEAIVSARSLRSLSSQDPHQIPVEGTQARGASSLPSRQPGMSAMGWDHELSAFSRVAGSKGLPLRTSLDGGREDHGGGLQGDTSHYVTHHLVPTEWSSLQQPTPLSCRTHTLAQLQRSTIMT